MLNINVSNALLNAFFARGGRNSDIPTTAKCWLGVSTTTPVQNADGAIGNFTEPAAATGYARVRLGIRGNAPTYKMSAAANSEIKNGSEEIHFNQALESGAGFGTVTHFGLFAAQSGGAPVVAGALTEPVTVPAGNILLARVDQLKMSME